MMLPELDAPLDVLAIGAHPDDAELFAGATLAMETKAGRRVGILSLTRGEMATRGTPEQRAEEFAAAAEVLGLAAHATLDLPDGALADDADQRLAVAAALRAWRPRLLLTHAAGDRHPDHNATHALVTAASFLANVGGAPLKGERHAIDRIWYFLGNAVGAPAAPSVIVDTTATHTQKIEALRCYATQFFTAPVEHDEAEESAADVPNSASDDAQQADAANSDLPATWIASEQFWDLIEARALTYGAMAGCGYGEPFLAASPPRLPLLSWV